MATENKYTSTGPDPARFAFTFPYLKEADVKVSIDGTDTTAFTFHNATTIQFNTASDAASGKEIRIYRVTDTTTPKATYFPGSAIKSEDLNDNQLQVLYTAEEVQDRSLQLGGTIDGTLTFGTNHKIYLKVQQLMTMKLHYR